MPAAWILSWWNLVFIAPLALALLYLTLYTISGVTFGDEVGVDADAHVDLDAHADADFHADADADVDAHADLDGDPDADLGGHANGDVHAEADADADAHAEAGGRSELPVHLVALGWLGVGKAPLSILLMVFLLAWGCTGFTLNYALASLMPRDWMVALASLPAALLTASLATRGVGCAMARWLPTHQTFVTRRSELVGAAGKAVFNISDTFGVAAIRDPRGDLFQVPCRVYEDRAQILQGSEVLVVDYDRAKAIYYVTPYEREA